MQKMKAIFRVLAETLLQAKWQMDKKEIHIDMERKRERHKNGYSGHMEITMERKDTKKRETDRGLTQSGEPPTLLRAGRATSCSHIVGRIRGNCLLYLFHGGGFICDGRTSAWSAWASLFGVEKRLIRAVRSRWIRFPHRFA